MLFNQPAKVRVIPAADWIKPWRLALKWVACFVLTQGMVPAYALNLDHLQELVKKQAPTEQMRLVNLAINEFDYAPIPGVWQTPTELASRGAGDCKDFAYAKYWLIKRMNIEFKELRLGYGRVFLDGRWQLHLVVLLWTEEDAPLVLDSATSVIAKLNIRKDLEIEFTFTEEQFFAEASNRVINAKRIKGWGDLANKMKATTLSQ